MSLLRTGTSLKFDTKNKVRFFKIGAAFILSNIFFFLLFSGEDDKKSPPTPEGWVEVQLEAQLLTPFHSGKKVLLLNRSGRRKLEGVLQAQSVQDLKLTILVREAEAHELFQFERWEILPFLKHMNFATIKREQSHEIRY